MARDVSLLIGLYLSSELTSITSCCFNSYAFSKTKEILLRKCYAFRRQKSFKERDTVSSEAVIVYCTNILKSDEGTKNFSCW